MKTVGKQLEEARQAKDWTPELAARETKIKIERLRDLESDDYSNFSSPTYARGFVRTYARSLGLDEYKLLRQLDNKLPEDDNASFANDTGIPYMPEPSQVSSPLKLGTGVYVAAGVGATVLFLIAFVLFQSYRAGYFAQATPAALPPTLTNVAPAVADTDPTTRALPADSNAAPVALPVDINPSASVTTAGATSGSPVPVALPVDPPAPAAAVGVVPSNNAVTVDASTPPVSTTPLDTKSPPRALPVDLSALTPADVPAPVAPAAEANVTPSVIPGPRSTALSARQANDRPAPSPGTTVEVVSTPPVAAPTPAVVQLTPAVSASVAPIDPAPSVSDTVPPAPAVAPVPDSTAPAITETPAVVTTVPQAGASARSSRRLVLTASHDSFLRVVSLDDPSGEHIRYASVLHSGQSVSFNDRKYSINVGVPSAVNIDLDGINYGPHSDHSAPDTFTVESRQP